MRNFALAVVAMIALLATGCGGGGSDSGGGTPAAQSAATDASIPSFTVGFPGSIQGLDVTKSADPFTLSVLALALEGPLVYDKDGKLKPRLAETWEQVDPTTYTYQLRSDVKFWDGTPLTAEDVVYSWRRSLDEAGGSQLARYFSAVKSVSATGPLEVTVKLKSPDPSWQYQPGSFPGWVVSKKFWEAHPKDIGTPNTLTMGTGPYKITEFVPDESVTLVRNEEYWGPKPAVEAVTIKIIPDSSALLLAMRSGELDAVFPVPFNQIKQWEGLSDVSMQFAPELRYWSFTLDMESEPWDDLHVRRALAHSVDRPGLVQALLSGHGAPADTQIPPEQWRSIADQGTIDQLYADLPKYEFDLDKAREELAQSAHPDGFSATLTYPDARPILGQAAQVLAKNVAELGIDLEVKEVPFNAYLQTVFGHKDLGIQSFSYGADWPDPANMPDVSWASSQAIPNGLNLSNYKSPTIDRLLEEQRTAPSEDRAALVAEAMNQAAEDVPVIPLFYSEIALALKQEFVLGGEGWGPWYFVQPWLSYVAAAA